MVSLKEKYKDYFTIGAAVSVETIQTHNELITRHFNSITCENAMKYANVCTARGKYDFTNADTIYEYAKNNGIALRGHTLTWHNQTPEWVFQNANRAELLKTLKAHIETTAGRYKDYIYCWDVVNEAISDNEREVFRKSPWTEIIGEDFMDYAFAYARDILPETKLYYNDYNETNLDKREKIYDTIRSMKERDIPIDGVGLQCHWNICKPGFDDVKRSFELYARLGLQLQITEMDVSLFAFEDKTSVEKPTEKMLERQAVVYEQGFRIFREYKDIIDNVTTWCVADDQTWLDNFPVKNRKNWPLLFDEQHKEKEALLRIMNF